LDRASDPPLAIAESAAAVAERAAEVAEAGQWAFTPDAIVAGELAAAAAGDAPGSSRRISPDEPGDPRTARARAAADQAARASRNASHRTADAKAARRWIHGRPERHEHWLRSRVCPVRRWWT
jgi:hypothetical protein